MDRYEGGGAVGAADPDAVGDEDVEMGVGMAALFAVCW